MIIGLDLLDKGRMDYYVNATYLSLMFEFYDLFTIYLSS